VVNPAVAAAPGPTPVGRVQTRGKMARNMRIALVISALGAGGAERVIIGLANAWAARGSQVSLITFEPPGTPPYYEVDRRVHLRQLGVASAARPIWRTVRQGMRRASALRHALRTANPDVAISFLAKINVLTVLATRGLGLPVIVSERNNPERQRFRATWRWLRARLYGVAYCVVTPSRGVLDSFPKAIRVRGRVIPNPVDLTPPRPRASGTRRLVAVGRLVHQKGFDLLLEAFAKIAPEHPDWSLTLFGEGEQRAHLEALCARLGVANQVQLPGVTGRPGQWVEEAEVFVLSSRFESFGNVVTEAMAAGLPVVAFDCPWGPGEILRDGEDGLLVPPEDVDALAAAVRRLIVDPELRRRLGEAGARNVRRFEKAAIVAKWDALIREAIAAGPRGNAPRVPNPAPGRPRRFSERHVRGASEANCPTMSVTDNLPSV
jgi:glycosyltransferase involved in cell wall biosynthesis